MTVKLTWRLEFEAIFPLVQTAEGENGSSFFAHGKYESVWTSAGGVVVVDGIRVSFLEWPQDREKEEILGGTYEQLILCAEIDAEDEKTMFLLAGEKFEKMFNSIIFLVQKKIRIGRVWIYSPNGECSLHTNSELFTSNPFGVFQSYCEVGGESGWLNTGLLDLTLDKKITNALHWYVKGIETNVVVDRYINFWIALEIMCMRSGEKVEVIEPCKNCNFEKITHRFGATIISYLKSLGAEDAYAKKLWEFRQIVHGRAMNVEQSEELSRFTGFLHGVLTFAIKEALGIGREQRPSTFPERRLYFGGGFIVKQGSAQRQ